MFYVRLSPFHRPTIHENTAYIRYATIPPLHPLSGPFSTHDAADSFCAAAIGSGQFAGAEVLTQEQKEKADKQRNLQAAWSEMAAGSVVDLPYDTVVVKRCDATESKWGGYDPHAVASCMDCRCNYTFMPDGGKCISCGKDVCQGIRSKVIDPAAFSKITGQFLEERMTQEVNEILDKMDADTPIITEAKCEPKTPRIA